MSIPLPLPVRTKRIASLSLIGFVLTSLFMGCGREAAQHIKTPRAVTVMTLQRTMPVSSFSVSGSVSSWKNESIAFEVSGRVQWVMEPGKNIEGRIRDPDGQLISAGTPLAQIDPSHFEVAVESMTAALEVAVLEKEGLEIRLNDAIPADIKAAQADLDLAKAEFERIESLHATNAVSQSEYDTSFTQVQTAQAKMSSLLSSQKQAQAELKKALAQIKSAEQNLRDANRNLEHTTLYGSYPGQISDIQVVPGSVVSGGTPVLQLQMMDPIRIEVELSAEQSREIGNRRQVPISFKMPDGSTEFRNAFVYMIDPSADPTTRTFTLTLLIMNKKFREPVPAEFEGQEVARAEDVWPLNLKNMIGGDPPAENVEMIEEGSIRYDGQSYYVWKVTNTRFGDPVPPVLTVERHDVTLMPLRIPFLGNWVFRALTFADPGAVDDNTMIVGNLILESGTPEQWPGGPVIVDSGEKWMLRPGDLVKVNLGQEDQSPGYYVPTQAIYQESGNTFLFVLQDDQTVQQVQVRSLIPKRLDTGSLIRVEPMQSGDFPADMKIVVDGVHFLQDGENVNVVDQASGV